MRYAVLSDIHGNLEALTAVLDALAGQRIDRYLCLGDVVGYGADPSACLARLQQLEALGVCGNHEWACIGKLSLGWFNDAAQAALEWTRDQLSFGELNELRRLPLVETVEAITMAHGSLSSPERFEYLFNLGQAADTLHRCRTAVCLVGHTHVPIVFEYDRSQRHVTRVVDDESELTAVSLAGDHQSRQYLINPGSVGQPRDGDPRASVAVLDLEAHRVAIQRIAYDIPSAQRKIRDAGLPRLLADRLALGR